MYVTAIIPAHNEAKYISKTIHSISHQVNRIIVACDNCSDNTYQVARESGADVVFTTINNHARKAGALNQALKYYVNWDISDLYIMVIDADTQIVPNWIEKAKTLTTMRPQYDAVGSVFYSSKSQRPSILELCQHNEWVRYANKIKRCHRVFVLTGTCSLISAEKLLAVHHKYHRFYDEKSVTEDFAMTIDLKSVGTRMISPLSCVCTTQTMGHYSDLIRQRRRWYLGALSLLFHRKLSKVTVRYWGQQLMLLLSVIAFMIFLVTSFVIYVTGDVDITLFWTVSFVIFDAERVFSIWNESLKDKLFAASMMPELFYSLILQWAYILAWYSLLTKSRLYWNGSKRGRK